MGNKITGNKGKRWRVGGCRKDEEEEKEVMTGCIPQLCLSSSSLMSPQSLSPSHIQDEAMHLPSSQRNWSALQVLTSVAAETNHKTLNCRFCVYIQYKLLSLVFGTFSLFLIANYLRYFPHCFSTNKQGTIQHWQSFQNSHGNSTFPCMVSYLNKSQSEAL